MATGEEYVPYHEIVRLIGDEKALILSKEIGGTSQYIGSAERMGGKSRLVTLIGMEAAQALAAPYGRTRIIVPAGPGQRARIWELRDAGWPVIAIARKVGRTERGVYGTLSSKRPAFLGKAEPPERKAPPDILEKAEPPDTSTP